VLVNERFYVMANIKWDYKVTKHKRHKYRTELEFYQLEEFHDEKLMLSHFKECFKSKGILNRCYIVNVWYVPGRKFQVLYRLSIKQGITFQ
jgi:calcineurin-like phosphoesterase family protein